MHIIRTLTWSTLGVMLHNFIFKLYIIDWQQLNILDWIISPEHRAVLRMWIVEAEAPTANQNFQLPESNSGIYATVAALQALGRSKGGTLNRAFTLLIGCTSLQVSLGLRLKLTSIATGVQSNVITIVEILFTWSWAARGATLTSTPLLGTISQSQPLKLKYTKLNN